MKTIALTTPIPYGDKTLSEFVFRTPRAGDLRGLKLAGLSEMDVSLVLDLAKRLSNDAITDAQLAELSPYDLIKVTEGLFGFFTPPAGASPMTP